MFENLGRAIGLLRELRGKSQAQLAREAGVGKSQLSKYENGKELPKLDSLERVLQPLGVGHFEFFYLLNLIDERASALGTVPPVLPTGAGSILNPGTQEAFQVVMAQLVKLYGMVLTNVILGARSGADVSDAPHVSEKAND